MEQTQSTTDLLQFLKTIHTQKDLDQYLSSHTTDELSFSVYFNEYLGSKHLNITDVIERSGLENHYAYQIINGTKKRPGRLKIIALCIGASMNLKETQRCLKLTKNASLYPKDTGDAIIITHINNEQFNIQQINEELWSHNLEVIK